jgi:hypothetical protein
MRGCAAGDGGREGAMNTPTPKADPQSGVGKFKYPPHPIAEIFPMLDPTSPEFLALVEDIKENDLREPITSSRTRSLMDEIAP